MVCTAPPSTLYKHLTTVIGNYSVNTAMGTRHKKEAKLYKINSSVTGRTQPKLSH